MYCRMLTESILQYMYLDLHLAIIGFENQVFGLLFKWQLKTSFTVYDLNG